MATSHCLRSSSCIGVIGTGYNAHKGAGTDYLCMADAPEWLSHSSASKFGYVAGVEYQDNYMGINANQNAVCSTCQSTRANKVNTNNFFDSTIVQSNYNLVQITRRGEGLQNVGRSGGK